MPAYSARRSVHPVGRVQRDGDLGRAAERRGARRTCPARRSSNACSRLCAAVPDDVELGLHLCYGDFGARAFRRTQGRRPRWSNSPTRWRNRPDEGSPISTCRSRSSAATTRSIAPLRDLKLADGTELFLGVVHAKDGVEGAKARIAAARPLRAEIRHRHRVRHGTRPLGGYWCARSLKYPCRHLRATANDVCRVNDALFSASC